MQKTHPNHVKSRLDGHFGSSDGFEKTHAKTFAVTSIGVNAFFSCNKLTSVTIPGSVNIIGEEAFFRCRGLTSVTIPSSVTSLGHITFLLCI